MDAKANGKERKHHKRHHKASTSSHEAPEHRHSRRSVAGLMNALRPRDRLAKSQSETSASVVTDILPNPALPRTMSTSPRSMSSAASAAMALPSETDSDSIDIPTVATERAALPDDAVICAIASTGSTSDLVSVDPPTTSTTSTSTSTSSTSTSSSSSYCASLTTVFPVPVVPLRDFQVIRLIGCGAVGTVFLVQLRGTDILFAMKVITKNRVRHSRKSIDSVLAERKFLATQPGHPFINKLFYACHTALHLILVLEYCSAGDLLAAIKRQPSSRFSEEQARAYIAEIVMALEYIHYKGFLYRDIKPENILLHADSHIRVIDFGLAKHQADYRMEQKMVVKRSLFSRKTKLTISNGPGPLMRTNSLVGSAFYVAPEMIKAQKSERGYDSRADWWALGVLLYEMLVGHPPFQGEQLPDVFGSIAQCAYEIPPDVTCSKEARHLLSRLMCPNPDTRLGGMHGAQEVKQHPFFRDVQWALVRHSTPPSVGEWVPDDPVSLLTPEQAFEHLEFMTAVNQDIEINPPDADFDGFPYCAPEFVEMLANRQPTTTDS